MRKKNAKLVAARAAAASLLSAVVLAGCGGGGGSGGDDLALRRTHLGEVRGAEDTATGTYAWKGIPYAKPPIGALRYLPVNAATTGFTARAQALNQIFFLASRDNVLNALKTQQANVWYYRFDWDKQPAPWNDIYGAVHVVDLPFLFGNFGPSLFGKVWFSDATRPGRTELSAAMMQMMANFARNGDPNNAALGVTWAAWPQTLVFDATPTTKAIHVE